MKLWLSSVICSVLVAGAALSACGSAPVASRFTVDASPDALVDEVQAAIVAEGFEVEEVNRRVGYVRSAWTTVPMENVSSASHRRYTVVLKGAPEGTQAMVRAEFKKCSYTAPPGSVETTTECTRTGYRSATCQTIQQESKLLCQPVDTILADDQQDLDAFAGHLRDAIGGHVSASSEAAALKNAK